VSAVVVVDYGSGNLRSASKALERAARENGFGQTVEVTDDPERVRRADWIVLPGVGAFKDCRDGLLAIPGLSEAMEDRVRRDGRPFLGVCVGMQLLATQGHEHETTPGLDWIAGDVLPIQPADPRLKIPHMGWNTVRVRAAHPVFEGIETGEGGLHAYFVHSFHLRPADEDAALATTDYGGPLVAAVARDTIVGTQFHPEKSQTLGLAVLANFLRWRP
jgi:glutamine amidotransferase